MEENLIKERVLKEVRNALMTRVHNPHSGTDLHGPVFPEMTEEKEIAFAENLSLSGTKLIYCSSEEEFIETVFLVSKQDNWKNVVCHEKRVQEILQATNITYSEEIPDQEEFIYITSCEALAARQGTIVLSDEQPLSAKALAMAQKQIVFGLSNQVFDDINHAMKFVSEKYKGNMPSFITAVNGTASQKTPALQNIPSPTGVKELQVFFIDIK